ncbi:hypothetical protein DL765_000156 [Monosporascus sp. GIB2]|nr:hypothetical protein DL765_000156 [Monosporascus sp. GIB2]
MYYRYTKDFEAGSRPSSAGSGTGEGGGTVDNLVKKMKAVTFEPTAASGTATASSSEPKGSSKQCKVNNKGPYPVKEQHKQYYVFINKKWLAIEKDGRKYTVKYNSKTWPAEMIG